MRRKSIVITGSKGLIGNVIIPSLRSDFIVYQIDKRRCNEVRYFKADISNIKQLNKVFQQTKKVNAIVHLAADSRAEADWNSVLENNIIGTRNVFECARYYKISKVIFASSNRVTEGYEKNNFFNKKQLIKITDAVRPNRNYATSKMFGETIARQYYELYGISFICLRIGSVLADDDPSYNPRHLKTWLSHRDLIQLFCKSLLSKVPFGIYYGVSNNKGRFWDISNAKKDLGYAPQDDASRYKKVRPKFAK